MNRYSTLEDHELTTLLSVGNEHAFVEIYNRYKTVLFLHARKMLDQDEQARDIVQEIFTVLWAKKQDIIFNTSLKSYLFSAVKNKVINLFMHQKHVGKHLESMREFYSAGNFSTDHVILEKELATVIETEIQNLPSRMREVFVLSRKEELSHREIAEKMGISEQTVKKQISYALKILRFKINLSILIPLIINILK